MKVIRKRMKALYCYNDFFVGYSKGKIYKCYFDDRKDKFVCRLPLAFSKKIFSINRILERAAHVNPRAAIALNKRTILIGIGGCIYRIDLENGKVVCEHKFPSSMNSPLTFYKVSDVCGIDDGIIYGEYFNILSPHDVCIYKRGLGIDDKWIKTFKYNAGEIQHVHGFLNNKYNDGLIVMTGDSMKESGFWEIRDNLKEMTPLLKGSLEYRACVGIVFGDDLYYATDNPYKENCLYRVDLNTKRSAKILGLNGTVVNGLYVGEKLYFSTTVENKPFKKVWQKYLPLKRAVGVLSNKVCIYVLDNLGCCEKIVELKKDKWYMPLFGFGTVEFCRTESNRILCNPIAVSKYDNTVLEL